MLIGKMLMLKTAKVVVVVAAHRSGNDKKKAENMYNYIFKNG